VHKEALVTGSQGFIGRYFAKYLSEELGYTVYAFDNKPSIGGESRDANEFFRSESTVANIRYDLVVHAAYHVGGRAAIDGNPSVLALNLALDANMFDWAVRTKQKHVLYFSSSAVYPVELQTGKIRKTTVRLAEDHACIDLPLLPDARYGWAKLTGEKLAEAAREQGLTVTVVRPFSGYAWNQSMDYPFPSIVKRVMDRESPVDVWGSGLQVRDWIHVSDVVAGAMAMVEADVHTVNLGTGIGTSMSTLIRMAMREAGHEGEIRPLRNKPDGVMERVADVSRMEKYYKPRILIEDGIREAVQKWGLRDDE
jgi:nucleoside-diphosphate-sugar epimerase